MNVYARLFKDKKIVLPNKKVVYEKRSKSLFIVLFIILFAILAIYVTSFDIASVVKGFSRFFSFFKELFPPDFSYFPFIVKPLTDTLKMSIVGTVFGAILAIPYGFLASSNIIKNDIVALFFKFIFSLFRTLPTLVTALFATFIFGIGTKAGTIAITLFTFSFLGKQLYEQIETKEMDSYEAMIAIGCSKPRAFVRALIPQISPYYLSSALYCFEGNLRNAAFLGYVGAGGIGVILNTQLSWRNYNRAAVILFSMLITIVIIEYISMFLRKKLS